MRAAATTATVEPARLESARAAGEDVEGSFDRGRGRILLRIVDAAAIALGTGPLLSLIGEQPPAVDIVVGALVTVGIIVLTVQHQRLALRRGRPWPPALTLAIQAALVYGPLPLLGEVWLITPAFLLTSIVCALPWRRAWPVATLVVAVEMPLAIPFDDGFSLALFRLVQICLTTAVLYGLVRSVGMAEELAKARHELAELAVVRERLRVARDLHDSLGQSLTAISLQAELAQRWCGKGDTSRAAEHLDTLLDLARSTGTEMRGLVSGYRQLTFAGEIRAATALLTARDVTPRVDVTVTGPFTSEAEQVLAWTLREAVTNAVRHAQLRACRISLHPDADGVALVVANDGAGSPAPGRLGVGGNGLLGIADRALSQGGWSQSRLADGWFELTVHLPATALAPDPSDTTARAAEEVA